MFDDPNVAALLLIGGLGAIVGLIGGVLAGSRRLVGTILMGVIGAVVLAAITRIGGAPPIYSAGNDFSFVYGAIGALVLSYVVGRSDRR